jgi:hypothetical protein
MLHEAQREAPVIVPAPGVPPQAATGAGAVYIVGMPRSGTKHLRGLLNHSPGMRVLYIETNIYPFLARWVSEHGEPHEEGVFERLYEALRNAPYFSQRAADRPFSWQEWRQWCATCDAGGLFEGFVRYETGTRRDEHVMWGDKSPAYIRHIDLLLQHFPDARIVHIVRDVRDHCVSMRRAWHKDVRRAAYQWGRDVAAAHRTCIAQPQRCIEVSYENLLRTPQTELSRLCAFLDLQYSDAMTRLHKPAEPARGGGRPEGATEIVQNNFGKYMQRLRPREIRDVESLAFDTMRALGMQPLYARRQRSMGRIEQTLRRLKDAVHLVSNARGKLGLGGALRFHLTHGRLAH